MKRISILVVLVVDGSVSWFGMISVLCATNRQTDTDRYKHTTILYWKPYFTIEQLRKQLISTQCKQVYAQTSHSRRR